MTTPTEPQYDADAWTTYMDVASDLARSLMLIPVRDMLNQLDQMEVLAPIMQPTRYRDGGADNLRDQADLLRSILEVQETLTKIMARHGA